jgi:hypothetical protein
MPHKCHGNAQNCPSRAHPIWEMPINELDRRDDPDFDEDLTGCHLVSSCSNVYHKWVVFFVNFFQTTRFSSFSLKTLLSKENPCTGRNGRLERRRLLTYPLYVFGQGKKFKLLKSKKTC